jgi:hypothetical protein
MPEENSTESNAATGPEGHGDVTPVLRRETEIESRKCECRQEPYFSKKTKDLIALFTLIAVGVYTCITILLWCNSNQQLATSRDTEKRDLRAYVYLDTKTITYPPGNSPNRFAISLNIKNSGKTWARKLIMINKVVPGAKGDPFDVLQWGDEASAPAILGPDQALSLQFGEVPFGDIPDIADRKMTYDYVVWIKYLDTVSRDPIVWQTQMSLHLIGDKEGTPGHISFGFNPTHNCADNDC